MGYRAPFSRKLRYFKQAERFCGIIYGMEKRFILKNEEDTYEYLNSRRPAVGDIVAVKTDGLTGTVQSVNVLRQTMKVLFEVDDDKEIREYSVDDVTIRSSRRKKKDRDKAEDAQAEEEPEELFAEEEEEIQAEEEPVKEQSRGPRRGRDRNRRKGKEKAESGAFRG